jgi:hypothetical protein
MSAGLDEQFTVGWDAGDTIDTRSTDGAGPVSSELRKTVNSCSAG